MDYSLCTYCELDFYEVRNFLPSRIGKQHYPHASDWQPEV